MVLKDTDAKVKEIFKNSSDVKLAYLFGSRARGDTGPLSDYDYAVYIDESDSKLLFDKKTKLLSELSTALGTDDIDLVILNSSEKPELKYNIISEGKLIHEVEPFKLIVEPRIMNEYFDFRMMLERNNLSKPSKVND